MKFLWPAFKALLTIVLLLIAVIIAVAVDRAEGWGDPMASAMVLLFLALAAAPWLANLGRSHYGAAFICVLVALFCAAAAYEVYTDEFDSPADCSRRRKLGCHAMNAMHSVLGPEGLAFLGIVASVWMLWTAGKLVSGARLAKKHANVR